MLYNHIASEQRFIHKSVVSREEEKNQNSISAKRNELNTLPDNGQKKAVCE